MLELHHFLLIISYCEVKGLNLEKPSEENLKYILTQLITLLDVANRLILDEKDYDLERYDELKMIYDHVVQAKTLSAQERSALIDELRSVRKR